MISAGRLILLVIGVWGSVMLSPACAQREQVWAFSDSAGLDFSQPGPVPILTGTYGFGEGGASVCDTDGALLFYTDGSYIWDRSHTRMPNGDELPGFVTNMGGNNLATSSTTQGAVIIPVPDSAGKYYVFSLTAGESTFPGRLYYSVVDMSMRGGYGDVIPGRKGILLDSGLTEKMTAVVGNRCNLWLLVHASVTTSIRAWEITTAGIAHTPVISNVGTLAADRYRTGVMKISPDRKRLVTANSGGGLEVYDFDPAAGIVSNVRLLDYGTYYGAAFSGDNSKLYVKIYNDGTVMQFDLSAPNPAQAKTWIGGGAISDLKLGPDGRIYGRGSGNSTWLSVIRQPNQPGAACDFAERAIQLSGAARARLGLPNTVPELKRDTVSAWLEEKGCFVSHIQISASDTAGWDYVWDDGTTGHTRVVRQSGRYILRYHTPPCVWHTDTFDVALFPYTPATGSFAGCKEDGSHAWIYSAGDTATYDYIWRREDGQVIRIYSGRNTDTLYTSPGRYTVWMQGNNGCDTTLDIIIPEPAYSASFDADTVVCAGVPFSFRNTSAGSIAAYQWDFGDGRTSTLQDPVHSYATPGIYTVRLATATSVPCYDTAYLRIRADAPATVSFMKDRDSVCAGTPIRFTPVAVTGADSVIWQFGDDRLTSGVTQDVVYTWDAGGVFPVTLTVSPLHCPDTAYTDTTAVFPYPLVDLGPDTKFCPGANPARLADLAGHSPGTSYLWSTGTRDPDVWVDRPGIYTLTVTSTYGCAATDTITVSRSCYMDIPNVFTPDGDGLNDYFFPGNLLAAGVSSFHIRVFNRWGLQVFETQQINNSGWDGTYKGQLQPSGVYVYIIEALFVNGAAEQYRGNVTLLY